MRDHPDAPEIDTTPEPSEADRQLAVETMRTLIGAGLDDLEVHWPLVERLVETRQRGLGFLTPDALAMQDEMLRKERAARYPGRGPRPVGQTFMRPLSIATASGDRPAPGNLAACSVIVDTHLTLADMARHMTNRLRESGVCLITGAPQDPSLPDLIRAVRVLVSVLVNVHALDNVAQHVERLVTQAKRLIDGDDKKKHPDPCPHCDRTTLVIYITQGVIRCEAETCRCSDPYCRCRFANHRHEWHRQPENKTQRSWWHLKDAIALNQRNNNEQGAEA